MGKLAILSAVTIVVGLAGSLGTAFAQSSGGLAVDVENRRGAAALNGPTVGGNFTSTVNTGDVSARADDGSVASNRIGSMTDGAVGGNVTLQVNTGDVTAEATEQSCAENVIGSIGTAACGAN